MADMQTVAEMNVAICRALGIDPEGIRSLTLKLDHDDRPRIEVEYSLRYIAALDLDPDAVVSQYAYELVPLADPAEDVDGVVVPPTLSEGGTPPTGSPYRPIPVDTTPQVGYHRIPHPHLPGRPRA